jgi:hypothetical protein
LSYQDQRSPSRRTPLGCDGGLDAHGTSCTFEVIGPSSRKIRRDVVETNGAALVHYLKGLAGRKHLCLEEGTQSAWLYEILLPHVDELVVAGISQSRGQKSDALGAYMRAEVLRTNAIKTSVFRAHRRFSRLRELARVHSMLVRDVVRAQSRIKVMYRARGISAAGKAVYNQRDREAWLKKLPTPYRDATARLHEQYDLLLDLKKAAEKDMLAEARKHPIAKVLATAPGMGPIRVAQLLPIVVTPHRFRTRRQFWSYCGLGIVMRTSSDWVPSVKLLSPSHCVTPLATEGGSLPHLFCYPRRESRRQHGHHQQTGPRRDLRRGQGQVGSVDGGAAQDVR